MKTKLMHASKSLLSIVLAMAVLLSSSVVATFVANAVVLDDSENSSVGAEISPRDAVGSGSGYLLYNVNDNKPENFKDTGCSVTQSGTEYTISIPASFFTKLNTNYYFGLSSSSSYQNMFFQNLGDITVTNDGNEHISSCGKQECYVGSEKYIFSRISFKSKPTGYVIVTVDSSDKTYNFAVTSSTVDPKYAVTVTAGTGGSVTAGSTTISAGTSKSVAVGSTTAVSLTATAKSGYTFSSWSVTGGASVASTSSKSTKLTATSSGTVTATFKVSSTTTRRIYFNNSSYDWDPPYAYAWTGSTYYLGAYPGKAMTHLKGDIWYVDVNTDAENILFNDGSDGNTQGSKTSNLTIPTNGNDYYNKGTWTKYTSTSSSNHFKASLGTSITSTHKSDVYTNIEATFYDYYTDTEYSSGWMKMTEAEAKGDWEPYQHLNKSLAEYASKNSISYPLYFGMFSGKSDGYAGYNNSTNYNFKAKINDSNALTSNNYALTGLTGKTLANGTIHHYKSTETNQNGAEMVLFDEDWLTSRSGYTYNNTLASIVESNFPVRKTTAGGGYDNSTLYLDTTACDDASATEYWDAYFYNSDDDFKWKSMSLSSGKIYKVNNPGNYAHVIFARKSAHSSDWDTKWNQTYNLDVPDGSDNKLLYKLSGFVNNSDKMDGSWIEYSDATSKGGHTYYEFDSTNAKDNIWFNHIGSSSNNMTIEYGQGSSYGVNAIDTGGKSKGYGFFPFDYDDYNTSYQHRGSSKHAYDYGFGMKLELRFTLGAGGKLDDGSEQVFDFSGDDDLWVYVDDNLVLDLGGAHSRTTGSINFATKRATASSSQSMGSATRNGSFTIDNNNPNKVHTMTIYYMERGKIESNLKFGFSFTPVGTEFAAANDVSYDNVNEGLADEVEKLAANDNFTITHKTATTQSGSYTTSEASNKGYHVTDLKGKDVTDGESDRKTTSSGTYNLKGDRIADFVDKFTDKHYHDINIVANSGNKFNYSSTLLGVVDTITEDSISVTKPSGNAGYRFHFETTKTPNTDLDATSLMASFENTLLTKTVTITEKLPGASDDTSEFGIEVLISLDGTDSDSSYKVYPVKYTLNGDEYTLGTSGEIRFKRNDTVTIEGIPENARVKVLEDSEPIRYWYDSTTVVDDSDEGKTVNTTDLTDSEGCTFKIANGDDNTGYIATIVNRPYRYKITYNFPSRIYGDQSYYVSGNITKDTTLEQSPESRATTNRLTEQVVKDFKPHEENFMNVMSWDFDNDVNYSYDAASYTYTATITATVEETYKPSLQFILPYDYTTENINGVNIFVPKDNTYYADGADPGKLTLAYKAQYSATNESGETVYVQAPSTLNKDGAEYKFKYWSIMAKDFNSQEEKWEEIARCYSTKYNYLAFGDYKVTPKYEYDVTEGGSLTEDVLATISLLGYTRNQWNGQKGSYTGTKSAMDTVFVDFNLSFQNKGELINLTENTKVGIIVENCGELKYDEAEGSYITDYNEYELADTSNAVKTFLQDGDKETFKSTTGMKNISKFEVDNSKLTNKNRIQYGLGINASENGSELGNKTSLYRAYSYIDDGQGNYTISSPVFFQIYQEAVL